MADHLPSPCLYGIAKPAVYLTPDSLADERRTAFVLAHELTHYRHRDYPVSYTHLKQAEKVGVGSVIPRSVPASFAVNPDRK